MRQVLSHLGSTLQVLYARTKHLDLLHTSAQALQRALFCLDIDLVRDDRLLGSAKEAGQVWCLERELQIEPCPSTVLLRLEQSRNDGPAVLVSALFPVPAACGSPAGCFAAVNELNSSSFGAAVSLSANGQHLVVRGAALLAGLDDDDDRCRIELTLNVVLSVLSVAQRLAQRHHA